MKFVYGNFYREPVRRVVAGVTAGEVYRSAYADAVSGIAVLDTTAPVVIEGSDDDFVTTVHQETFTGSGVAEISSVAALAWRMRATGSGTAGMFYIGTFLEFPQPSFPFAFETSYASDDVTSRGGGRYSRVIAPVRSGDLSWEVLTDDNATSLRDWYRETRGGRYSFVLTNPINPATPHLVRAGTDFPLRQESFNNWSGGFTVTEVPGV